MSLTFEFLNAEYVGKGRSLRDIAQEVGKSRQTVLNECRRLGIQTRPRGRPQKSPTPHPDLDAFVFSEQERAEYLEFLEFYKNNWPQSIDEAFFGGWQFHKRYLWNLEHDAQEQKA